MGGGVGYVGVCVWGRVVVVGGLFAVAIWTNLLPRLQQKLLRQRQAGFRDTTTCEFPRGAGCPWSQGRNSAACFCQKKHTHTHKKNKTKAPQEKIAAPRREPSKHKQSHKSKINRRKWGPRPADKCLGPSRYTGPESAVHTPSHTAA